MTIPTAGDENTLSTKAIREYTSFGGIDAPVIQQLFSIFIVDPETNLTVQNDALDPTGQRNGAEYFFRVPPKSIEISEPFATTIVPTQNGGKFVESQGSILKGIRLQGTTGFRPHRNSKNVVQLFNTATSLAATISGQNFLNESKIPVAEITGHDDIIFLRNLFRFYSDQKSKENRKMLMVFRNVRDDDYWVVEPEDFRLVRDSSSPLTYEYQIQLKTLGKYTATANISLNDPIKRIKDARRFAARVQTYNQALTNSFLILSTQITRISAAGWSAVRTVFEPLSAVIRGTKAIYAAGIQVKHSLLQAVKYVKDLIKEGLDLVRYGFKPHDPAVRTLRRTYVVLCRIQTEVLVRDSVASNHTATATRQNNVYRGKAGNALNTETVAQGVVHAGENIRTLAKRLTGNADNWRTIVQINNLRPPYVSNNPTATEGVLRSGDPVLYPSLDRKDLNSNEITASKGVSEDGDSGAVIEAFGRDLRLKSAGNGQDIDLTDLQDNQQGDLSTIAGIPNVEQAVKIKFSTEQGELPKHSYFGTKYPIGSKATVNSFNSFRINALATFNSDPRIKEVQNLVFETYADALVMSAKLLLSDSKNFLTTDFALRRF